MIDRRQAKRIARVGLRELQVFARRFRLTFLSLFVLLMLGTLILMLTYSPAPTEEELASGRLNFGTALHAVFKLMFFETLLDYPEHVLARFVFLMWPVLGMFLVVNGIVSLGTALTSRRQMREDWLMAVASTCRNHIVVCGLGRVGYRVVLQLLEMQQEIVGVESDAQGPFLDRIREEGVPVLIGDARNREILEQAGVPVASAIVACTEDDLTNLEVALDARDLNPGIKVVMRMFDQRLAERIRKGFGIRTAFSTSALAAPALAAAATRASVEYSFYVDDVLLNVSSVTVKRGAPLVGRELEDVEQELDISIILCQGEDGVDLHPEADRPLSPGDQIVVFATLEALASLNQLNQSGNEGGSPAVRRPPKSGKGRGWLDRLRRKGN